MPVVGWALGLIVALGLAIAQFGFDAAGHSLCVAGVLVAGMALDTAFLSPRLVGEKVGLHPVWLIFALFAFSYLFGFVGTLIAVPLAAAVVVLVRHALKLYHAERRLSRRSDHTWPRGARHDARDRASWRSICRSGPRLAAEDFMVSAANADGAGDRSTVGRIGRIGRRGRDGPAQSGKTHLANVWRYRSGGDLVDRRARSTKRLAARFRDSEARWWSKNLETRRRRRADAVSSAQHRARAQAVDPADVALGAGRSRGRISGSALAPARAAAWCTSRRPTRPLLEAVLVKHFADRQLTVEPQVVDHIARHMERSFAAAARDRRGHRPALAGRPSGVSRVRLRRAMPCWTSGTPARLQA